MMDANKDIWLDFSWNSLTEKSIYESIAQRYGDSVLPTYNKGKQPSNSISLSLTLQMAQGGYLSFGQHVLLDHQGIWVDI